MRKLFTLLLLSVVANDLAAQRIIDSKISAELVYHMNNTVGSQTVAKDGYTSPSLVNNFKGSTTLGIAVSYKFKRNFHAHIELLKTDFVNWENGVEYRYQGATSSLLSFQPQVTYSTPFSNVGLLNRFSFLVTLGPSFALHSVELSRATYTPASPSSFDFQNSTSFVPGIACSVGTTFNYSNRFTLGVSYGFTYYGVSSALFDDESLSYTSIQFRVGARLANLKRFKYQSSWYE